MLYVFLGIGKHKPVEKAESNMSPATIQLHVGKPIPHGVAPQHCSAMLQSAWQR